MGFNDNFDIFHKFYNFFLLLKCSFIPCMIAADKFRNDIAEFISLVF